MVAAKVLEATIGEGGRLDVVVPEAQPGERIRVTVETVQERSAEDTDPEHLELLEMLPLHHRDPFDRLLVAQAMVEGVPILSADSVLDAYGLQRVW